MFESNTNSASPTLASRAAQLHLNQLLTARLNSDSSATTLQWRRKKGPSG